MADLNETIAATRETIRGYLAVIDPEFQEYDSGMFTIEEGSAVIGITIRPWMEDDVVIEFSSQLCSSGELSAETMKWLLEANADIHFGGFGMVFDGTIIYNYAIPGSNLDPTLFAAVTQTVAAIADHYDDIIRQKTGVEAKIPVDDDRESVPVGS